MPPRRDQRISTTTRPGPDTRSLRALFVSTIERLQNSPPTSAQGASVHTLYVTLKQFWYEAECAGKVAAGKQCVVPVSAWQRWLADPFNTPDNPLAPALLIEGVNQGDGTFYFAYYYPTNASPLKVLRFHTGVIVSPTSWHDARIGRAWICYESKSDSRGVPDRGASPARWYLPTLLYGVSADTAADISQRELLTFQGELTPSVRNDLRKAIEDIVDKGGDEVDVLRGDIEPGTIVTVAEAYDALVLASWSRFSDPDKNPLLVAQIIPIPAGPQPSADELATTGRLLLPDNTDGVRYSKAPALVSLGLLRPIKRELVRPIGSASPILNRARKQLMTLLSEVAP